MTAGVGIIPVVAMLGEAGCVQDDVKQRSATSRSALASGCQLHSAHLIQGQSDTMETVLVTRDGRIGPNGLPTTTDLTLTVQLAR